MYFTEGKLVPRYVDFLLRWFASSGCVICEKKLNCLKCFLTARIKLLFIIFFFLRSLYPKTLIYTRFDSRAQTIPRIRCCSFCDVAKNFCYILAQNHGEDHFYHVQLMFSVIIFSLGELVLKITCWTGLLLEGDTRARGRETFLCVTTF